MPLDRSKLTLEQRWELADYLAKDNLSRVNKILPQANPKDSLYSRYVKRLIDIVISIIGVVITLPINLLIGIITFFDVGRPVFFKQKRIGKNGKQFEIKKFRNMRNTRDERGELLPASQRVTKFGKIVRKTSLDELMNFWYVLKGDMSIIGPRPLLCEYLSRYSDRHKQRLAVRPGLECPPRELKTPMRTWEDQFENDIWYVENISLKTDMLMCIRLVQFALDRKNIEARASATSKGIFMGYNESGEAINLEQIPEDVVQRWYKQRNEAQ